MPEIRDIGLVGVGMWSVSDTKGYKVALLEMVELPAHKGVVVRVVISRDEGSPPVDARPKLDKVTL